MTYIAMRSDMKTLKICLVILCLLSFRTVGTPQSLGATFFMENLEGEEWKSVVGFDGIYEISNLGRIKALDRFVFNKANGTNSWLIGCIKKLDTKGKKYAQIGLARNGKYKKMLIHRLVAIAFIPNPLNLPEVNHKDHDKLNNRASNLEWVTRKKNAELAKEHGKYMNHPKGENRHNSILTKDAVIHIRQKVLRNIDYCKLYGVKPSTVCCIQNPEKYKGRWKDAQVA